MKAAVDHLPGKAEIWVHDKMSRALRDRALGLPRPRAAIPSRYGFNRALIRRVSPSRTSR
ncbi:hypothetical protein ABIE45_000033 [Methylobacterium sp. OAE515]|jgi:hypothetical protein